MKYLGPLLLLLIVLGGASVWLWAYPQLLDHFQGYPRAIYDVARSLRGYVG